MPIVQDGLIIYYHASNGVIGNTWNNSSPNRKGLYNATVNGSTIVQSKYNPTYFSFDGVDDYILFGGLPNEEIGEEYEIEIYIKSPFDRPLSFPSYSSFNTIYSNYKSKLMINRDGTTIETLASGSYNYSFSKTDVIKLNYSFNNIDQIERVYINDYLLIDKKIADSSGDISALNSISNIGSDIYKFNYYKGSVYSFKMYNRRLTDAERSINTSSGYASLGLSGDTVISRIPIANVNWASKYKVSHLIGHNTTTISFNFDEETYEWCARLNGSSYDTGVKLDGKIEIVAKGVNITTSISGTGLIEGENRINIYGKNKENKWSEFTTNIII